MAFAVFYRQEDLLALAAEATSVDLTGTERNTANRYWSGGLKDWAAAPYAGDQFACVNVPTAPDTVVPGAIVTQNPDGTYRVCDPDIRVVVMSGAQVTKAGLVAFLRQIGTKYANALYMLALADDIELTAVEPYP